MTCKNVTILTAPESFEISSCFSKIQNVIWNCLFSHGANWHDTAARKFPIHNKSLLLDIRPWLCFPFPLESEVTLSGPVWLTVHHRYNSTKGADVFLISLPQIGKQHLKNSQRSMDFPWPGLSWLRPLSYMGEGETPPYQLCKKKKKIQVKQLLFWSLNQTTSPNKSPWW